MDKKNEMCLQAAWGLEYLHAKNVLHRDIAARNCLYGDNKARLPLITRRIPRSLQVKISDFGLTREGTVYQMDPHKRVPIRWLAPETLKMAIYTQKTDVFSFGKMSFVRALSARYPGNSPEALYSRLKWLSLTVELPHRRQITSSF
ncbi:hypothetical protein COOONC_20132 [Cooperia oncophora]